MMVMKKVFIGLMFAFFGAVSLSAQGQDYTGTGSTSISAMPANSIGSVEDVGKYKLYPTENMWTFLKLNTQTGQIYQLQYSVKDNNYGEAVVSGWKLNAGEPEQNGRFELYPTENLYTFLLLDKNTGAVYQVHWSLKAGNRGLYKISEYEE